ncbi:MAG: glutamate 5-kinase [Nitrososphaeria archaeon]|jgi:glutamate 5-kinase
MKGKKSTIVVKVGTSVLSDGKGVSEESIKNIAYQISELIQDDRAFVLVSSGAILSGITILRLNVNPHDLSLTDKQVCASIGQPFLMSLYAKYFREKGVTTAQMLFTEEDLANKIAYKNVWRTLHALLERDVVPIINENDAVSVRELLPINPYVPDEVRFGDNDRLSAIIASKLKSQLLVMLTDVEGYYEVTENGTKKLLREINFLNSGIMKFAQGKGKFGRGGMKSKLHAARIVSRTGIEVVIANGKKQNILQEILSGKKTGTRILPISRKKK